MQARAATAVIVRNMPRPGGGCRARQTSRPLGVSKSRNLRLPANDHVTTFIQNTKRRPFYLVFDARATLAGLRIDYDEIVTIRDYDTGRFGRTRLVIPLSAPL
jgi:hypothetical protein